MIRFLFQPIFILLSAVIAHAATCPAVPTTSVIYYVATNESGASNTLCDGLSPTNQGGGVCPFKDFTTAAVRAKLYKTAGDVSPTKNVTIKVRTGTYIIEPLEVFVGEPVAGIYINANGANVNESVVLTNYNDEVVTLEPGALSVMMEVYGDRVVVQGLRFNGAADRNAQLGATNMYFGCNHLTGGEDSVKNTTATGPVTIHGNTFTGHVQAIDATTAQDWTVTENVFSNGTKGVGFKANAINNTITANTCSNLTAECISMGAGGSLNHAASYEATNIVANNNLIQNVGLGIQALWCSGCQITNNQIIGASIVGVYLGSDETTEQSGCQAGAGCLPTTGLVVTGNNFHTITNNTFISGKNPQMITGITAGTNTYCVTSGSEIFRYGTVNLNFADWKTATGTDATSSLSCAVLGTPINLTVSGTLKVGAGNIAKVGIKPTVQ